MTVTYLGLASTFRTQGAAATTQNIFSIANASGSAVILRVRRLVTQLDATAALTAVMPQVKTSRSLLIPSGGTVLLKGNFDTTKTSNASVVLRQATASDGGSLTPILANPGDIMWQQYCMRLHTAVGQVLATDETVLPELITDYPVVVRANQALLVQVVASAGSSNPATNMWFTSCVWEEADV